MVLMIAVLFFYSKSYYASTGGKWFALGPITFQPAEIMKPAFIILLARVITDHNISNPDHHEVGLALVVEIIYGHYQF